MMNSEVKVKWLAALRSGKYKQTTEVLRDCKGFCCLGVLTDLYIQEKNQVWEKDEIQGEIFYHFEYDADNISTCVIKWSGLDSCDPDVSHEGELTTLTSLNDYVRLDFNQIADVIEEQL